MLKKELAKLAQVWHDEKIGFKMPNKGYTKEEGEEGEEHHVVCMEIFADNITHSSRQVMRRCRG